MVPRERALHFAVPPAGVAEFNHILKGRVEAVEQALEQFFGVGSFGWRLEEHGAQLLLQALGYGAVEIGENGLRFGVEFLVVRDLARRFHRKPKIGRATFRRP